MHPRGGPGSDLSTQAASSDASRYEAGRRGLSSLVGHARFSYQHLHRFPSLHVWRRWRSGTRDSHDSSDETPRPPFKGQSRVTRTPKQGQPASQPVSPAGRSTSGAEPAERVGPARRRAREPARNSEGTTATRRLGAQTQSKTIHKIRQSKANQGTARHSKAKQGKARQIKAQQGKAMQSKAKQGKVRQSKARYGKAMQISAE